MSIEKLDSAYFVQVKTRCLKNSMIFKDVTGTNASFLASKL